MERKPDGGFEFREPNGRVLPEVPRPPKVPELPADALKAEHEACGLYLNGKTSMPLWLGERLDVRYAIDVLHPLAEGSGG